MSMTERPVDAALKTMLVSNEPVQYAHLVKFERPSRPDSLSGLVSTAKQRYTYLTDASINVTFDDGSRDLQGNLNGSQVYLANKVINVGTIQETTKATTSSTSLVLDGTGLGASIVALINIVFVSTGVWDLVFQAPVTTEELIGLGFREGDKVTVNGVSVNIQAFRTNNSIRVAKIDTDLNVGTAITATVKLASEEIISILLNKNSNDYSSFINREVFIYRAYFRDGTIVGQPILIFKGIIFSVNFEDSESNIRVTWGLTSHWGDFAQVRGRITSDASHRALNENDIPNPASALKPIYAYDKGFIHSEVSLNTLAKYTTMVPDFITKTKKGFLGIGAKVKIKKVMVEEERQTNLDFQLSAKAIPVLYGVRIVDGIGVFADTLNDDSSTVFTATVLSEGEIGGIYDVLIENNSLICNDKADFDARATQTNDNTVQLVCRGRADRGDALGGQILTSNADVVNYYNSTGEADSLYADYNYVADWRGRNYGNAVQYNPNLAQFSSTGIKDGETINLTSPQQINLDFFSGKPGQKASAQLSQIAYQKNFKVQNSYWTGSNTSEYWGPNHRLLDTAYVVGKYKIEEGETTIPEIKYIVRGKVIDCYNYDYSYSRDVKTTGENADNFLLGEVVTLHRSDTNAVINSNVQIIDKWTIQNPDGTSNTRFRFDVIPNLGYDTNGIPSITKFYMRDASSNNWTMITHNHNYLTGAVPGAITAAVTGVTNVGGFIAFSYASNTNITIEGDPIDTSPKLQLMTSALDTLSTGNLFKYAIMTGTITTVAFTSGYSFTEYGAEAQALFTGNVLASKNTVRLSASASVVADFYVGSMIEITRFNSLTGKSLVQTAEIVSYDGITQIATIDTIWDFIPTSTDTFRVYPKYADARVSINPAIQLLDYITSPTYGRGLHYTRDLNLPSWLDTARTCDTKSNVTVLSTTDTLTVFPGDIYRLTINSVLVWQGKVASKFTSGGKFYIEFTDCIGKLTNQWNDWKAWKVGDVLYNSDFQFFRVDTAGVISTKPTATGGTVTLLTSLPLTKVSGTGPVTVDLTLTNGNPVQSVKNGTKISGYSLYDSDDINYWRLSGWEEHAQRYVTRNQTNLTIDTSSPLFDNINSLLEHFNGILRYTAGQYYLDTEELAGVIFTNDIRTITSDDIIGKIQLSDEGTRSAFNSITAAFADPANKFEARSISFFNSEYLKADKNVPKKGNLSIPGITNYYNTRLLADSFLNKSRFGLTISMTIRTHGILFLAGTVIQVIYPRYDWTSPGKKFRIETITYQPDGMADIVAKEYDDSFYSLVNLQKAAGTGLTSTTADVTLPASSNPSNLVATQNLFNQIQLSWNPGLDADPNSYTEIWRSTSNSFTNAQVIALTPVVPGVTNYFVDNIPPQAGGQTTLSRFYWVRRKVITT